MKVFSNVNRLRRVDEVEFKLEKDMQILVENNLDELLGLSFVASEYSIKDYRFDTVAFDDDSNAFIIIEYKRGKNNSLVDQGYAYLSTLLEYKANLVLLYNEKFNKSKQIRDFNWSNSRIYFVSSKFTKYQTSATSFADMPFNLFEIKQYKNGIILFDEINKNDNISTKEINTTMNTKIEEVNKEIIVYTENMHLDNKSDEAIELYNEFKNRLFELGDVSLEIKKMYITFKIKIPIFQVVVMKNKLKIYIDSKYIDSVIILELGNSIRDVSNIGHWGSFNYEYIISSLDDIEDLVFYTRKILSNNIKELSYE